VSNACNLIITIIKHCMAFCQVAGFRGVVGPTSAVILRELNQRHATWSGASSSATNAFIVEITLCLT
jgi:hypothetical protein